MVQIRVLQNYEKQMFVLDLFVTFIDKDLVEDITVGPGFFKRQVLMVKFLSRVLLEIFCQVNLSEKGKRKIIHKYRFKKKSKSALGFS